MSIQNKFKRRALAAQVPMAIAATIGIATRSNSLPGGFNNPIIESIVGLFFIASYGFMLFSFVPGGGLIIHKRLKKTRMNDGEHIIIYFLLGTGIWWLSFAGIGYLIDPWIMQKSNEALNLVALAIALVTFFSTAIIAITFFKDVPGIKK